MQPGVLQLPLRAARVRFGGGNEPLSHTHFSFHSGGVSYPSPLLFHTLYLLIFTERRKSPSSHICNGAKGENTPEKTCVLTPQKHWQCIRKSVPNVHCIQNKIYYFFCYNLPPKIVPVFHVFFLFLTLSISYTLFFLS